MNLTRLKTVCRALTFACCAGVLFLGCATGSGSGRKQNVYKTFELNNKNFHRLYQDMMAQKLAKGTPDREIRQKYGTPADIMRSSSSTGTFEIWSYEKKVTDKPDSESWDQIRLYFNNHKLVSWTY